MSFAVAQYRSAQVETASPERIVVQLYDGAIRFLSEAVVAVEAGDLPLKNQKLKRAHAIVSELQLTLDPSHAPELCADLDRLYDFVLHRISVFTLDEDGEAVEPAIRVMKELRAAWAQLAGVK